MASNIYLYSLYKFIALLFSLTQRRGERLFIKILHDNINIKDAPGLASVARLAAVSSSKPTGCLPV